MAFFYFCNSLLLFFILGPAAALYVGAAAARLRRSQVCSALRFFSLCSKKLGLACGHGCAALGQLALRAKQLASLAALFGPNLLLGPGTYSLRHGPREKFGDFWDLLQNTCEKKG